VNAQVRSNCGGQPYEVIVNANNALTTPQSFQAGRPHRDVGSAERLLQADHPNGTAVTEAAPAKPGENIRFYLQHWDRHHTRGIGPADRAVRSPPHDRSGDQPNNEAAAVSFSLIRDWSASIR